MKLKKLILLFIVICITNYYVFASDINPNAGTTAFPFLKIGIGARPTAMGEAFVSISNDPNAIYWNPAGLSQIKSQQFIAEYKSYIVGVKSGFAGMVYPYNQKGSIGVGLTYLSAGKMDRMTPLGVKDGTFGSSDIALTVGYGQKVKFVELGVSGKIIYETIDRYSAHGVALDFGGLYHYPNIEGLTVGASVTNLGKQIKAFIEENYGLPLTARLGVSYTQRNFTLSTELKKPIDNDISLNLGSEFWLKEVLALRFGYNTFLLDSKTGAEGKRWYDLSNENYSGLSAGLGVKYEVHSIDYSFVPFGELGNIHRFSITMKF